MFNSESKVVSGPVVPPIYHPNATLGSILLHCLSRDPNFVIQANYDDETEFTCGEVKLMSIRIAQNLSKFGLKLGDEIGLFMKNSKYLLPLAIGSFTMGFPICPIEISLFDFFIESVKPKIWFCENEYVEMLEGFLKKYKFEVKIVTMSGRIDGYLDIGDFLEETGQEERFM